MAIRTLWRFVVGRAKTVLINYNVIERAEKVMESKKIVPPRHPGTEMKFEVLVKERKEIQEDLKKHDELLDRLKSVKVTSEDALPEQMHEKRTLPQERMRGKLPLFGFEEPKIIPEGKCSLRQALEFITNHQNDPTKHTIASIAEAYKMKPSEVAKIINNFRAFALYISPDGKAGVAKSMLESLGVNKVVKPLFKSKFRSMEESTISGSVDEKK